MVEASTVCRHGVNVCVGRVQWMLRSCGLIPVCESRQLHPYIRSSVSVAPSNQIHCLDSICGFIVLILKPCFLMYVGAACHPQTKSEREKCYPHLARKANLGSAH